MPSSGTPETGLRRLPPRSAQEWLRRCAPHDISERNWWQLSHWTAAALVEFDTQFVRKSRPYFSNCSTAYAVVSAVTHKVPPEAAVHSPLLCALRQWTAAPCNVGGGYDRRYPQKHYMQHAGGRRNIALLPLKWCNITLSTISAEVEQRSGGKSGTWEEKCRLWSAEGATEG
jgi:hypothetical protein